MQDVEMPTTLHLLEQFRGEDSAPPKEARLSDAQKEFCLQIIANGGNASQAALDAGYKHPEVASAKLMLNFGVVHMINRLTVELWKGKIPALLGNLHSVAFNPKATDRARVDATNSLLDRLGAIVPKGPSTAIQINNGGAGEGPIKAQAQIIITELWTARSEREQRKQAVHRAVDNIIEQNAARKVSRIDGTMTDTIDPALALLEHIADGDGMGGDAFSRVPSRPAHIPVPPDKNIDENHIMGVSTDYDSHPDSNQRITSTFRSEDSSRADGLLGLDGDGGRSGLWSDEDWGPEGEGDARVADAGREAATGGDERVARMRQSALREAEASSLGQSSGERERQGGAGTDARVAGFGSSCGEADGGEGSVYSLEPSGLQGFGSGAGSGPDGYTGGSPREGVETRGLTEEKEDGYREKSDESVAAGCDTAGGFGGGEGIGAEDGTYNAEPDGSDDDGGTGFGYEIFSRFHSRDVVGSGAELADAGEVAGIVEGDTGDAGGRGLSVVWSGTVSDASSGSDDTDAEAVDDAGSRPRVFQREREVGAVQPGGIGNIFADD